MAVFQARAATSPRAVVISSENLSGTSLVKGISFHSSFVLPSSRRSVGVSVRAVLRVCAQELFDRVDVPPDDNLHLIPFEARPDTGLPPDATPDILPGRFAGSAFQPLRIDEPARTPVPYHQQVQSQPSGGFNVARRSNSPASSHGHRPSRRHGFPALPLRSPEPASASTGLWRRGRRRSWPRHGAQRRGPRPHRY